MHFLLRRLIERHHRLEFFKNTAGLPQHIIETAKNLVKVSVIECKRTLNIDAVEYLTSIQGQIDYADVINTNKINQLAHDRCGRCKKHQFKNTIYSCMLYDEIPLNCKSFEDYGKDIDERISIYVEKCSNCMNGKTLNKYELDCNIPDKNLLDCEYCTSFQEKPSTQEEL
jgi:hypothetical protein